MMDRQKWKIVWISLIAIAFGYCEAATVAYIRLLAEIPPGIDYRAAWATGKLALNGETILSKMSRLAILPLEYGREIATLVLLAGVAMSAGQTKRARAAWFALCFAVWDLTYYLWLTLFCGFPKSLFETDIYFLLPFPTFGPVWFPLIIMSIALAWSMKILLKTGREK